jgi:hypothetical protein
MRGVVVVVVVVVVVGVAVGRVVWVGCVRSVGCCYYYWCGWSH